MNSQLDRQFLETILSSVADGVFTVDRNLCVTSINRAAEQVLGVTARDAVGAPCADVLHGDRCQRDCPLRKTLATGQQLVDQPATILSQRGASIPISLSTAVLKDGRGKRLGAVQTFRDLSTIVQLRRELHSRYTFEDIVGRSAAFQKIFSILPDVADSDATVLIEGPTGTGKELLARAVHNLSPRRSKPYVVVNCGALPAELFESEVFGYVQGAFTDAKRDKLGRIALAEGGTVVFDEVGELPLPTQVKLLRLLQQREYEPLGGVRPRRADVRIVAATNRDLAKLVEQGRFRDDLYFRLAVVRMSVPPLAERREDIPYLVEHFIGRFNAKQGKQITGVSPAVMEALLACELPGNARQLENIIEHAFVLCHNSQIDVAHLPEDLRSLAPELSQSEPCRVTSKLKLAEAQAIRSTLAHRDGALIKTARELGISRTTLWRKMKRYGISAPRSRMTGAARERATSR